MLFFVIYKYLKKYLDLLSLRLYFDIVYKPIQHLVFNSTHLQI